jgi:hypothetical protein
VKAFTDRPFGTFGFWIVTWLGGVTAMGDQDWQTPQLRAFWRRRSASRFARSLIRSQYDDLNVCMHYSPSPFGSRVRCVLRYLDGYYMPNDVSKWLGRGTRKCNHGTRDGGRGTRKAAHWWSLTSAYFNGSTEEAQRIWKESGRPGAGQ